jgi:probable phosphoglycerate mutase
MTEGGVDKEYEYVTKSLDELLRRHGYRRKDNVYEVTDANEDTIAFFCHFGLECVLLSHLLGISPMVLWHGFVAAPTSVTTVYTEERRQGTASFRVASFGDVSHLSINNESPAFSARYCETYNTVGQRRDD